MPVDQLAVLEDRYVLNEVVGRGGMADVYRATDRVLRRQVAVKILRETEEGPNRARFLDEARTLASLNHPGLITLLDAGFQADHPYLVMELADGPSLSGLIAEGPMEPARVARIGGDLAEALSYAHRAEIVHRDVKPSNILICEDGRVLLADFGIARLIDGGVQHTRTGEAIGSPAYLSPEQVAGEPLTTAADIYSLGLVLLEALTAVRAYGGTPVEAAIARLTAAPEVPDSIGVEWGDLIRSMTARSADARPSAAEVATALSALVLPEAETGAEAAPVPPPPEDTQALDLAVATAASLAVSTGASTATTESAATSMPTEVPGRRSRLSPRVIAVLVVAALLAAVVVAMFAVGTRGSTPPAEPTIPSGVPADLQDPLRDLHDAVEGSP